MHDAWRLKLAFELPSSLERRIPERLLALQPMVDAECLLGFAQRLCPQFADRIGSLGNRLDGAADRFEAARIWSDTRLQCVECFEGILAAWQ